MPSSETDPKPSKTDKPTERDVQNTKEEDKNVDRDGGERQPVHYTDEKK
jgi:hypothetical protein